MCSTRRAAALPLPAAPLANAWDERVESSWRGRNNIARVWHLGNKKGNTHSSTKLHLQPEPLQAYRFLHDIPTAHSFLQEPPHFYIEIQLYLSQAQCLLPCCQFFFSANIWF